MQETSRTLALGCCVVRGGAAVVALSGETAWPRLRLSRHLPTAEAGDALALAPYQTASALPRGPSGAATDAAEAAVAEGRARQAAAARESLAALLRELAPAPEESVVSVLLVNRAGWIADLLDYSLAFVEHARVAEGLAVRDALRSAFAAAGLPLREQDEKTLPQSAQEALGLSDEDIALHLRDLGAVAGRPWRREQKAAALAAWMALAPLPAV